MCDYSLENVASRAAVKSERLVTTQFPNTFTRGFASISDPNTAVCLLPGTEIVFHSDPKVGRLGIFSAKAASTRIARFRQINLDRPHRHHDALELDRPYRHHDALEFADGTIVLLTRLKTGQLATIVQLPRQQSSGDTGSNSSNVAHGTPERRALTGAG